MADYYERDVNERVVIHAHESKITLIFRRKPDNEYEIITHDEAREMIAHLEACMRRFPEVDARTKHLRRVLRDLGGAVAGLQSALEKMSAEEDRASLEAALRNIREQTSRIKVELGASEGGEV